jgi:invasion protein IalB
MKSAILGLAGLLLAAPALAAPAAAPANPAPPSQELIGKWTVVCVSVPSPQPCEMTQAVDLKDSGQRLLTISFIYVPSRDQNWVVMQVPLGVSIANGLVLKTDAFTSPKLPYHQCTQNGCMAQLPIDKQTLETLGTTTNAMVKISDSTRSYDLKLDLNGFSKAKDRLTELAKAKATNPPPAPPPQAPAGGTPDTSVIK